MFDSFFDSLNPLTAFDIVDDPFEPITDYLSGYTSANAAQRFNVANMSLQQQYNEQNMALTDLYQRALMLDSPSIQKAALSKAGFNPLLAIGSGISSPSSTVHATNPTSASPQVQSQLGNLISGISAVTGIGSTVADIVLKGAQTKAATAQSAESAARTIKTMKESDSIDPELEKDLKRYPGRLGKESLSLRNGVTQPIFNIINSAYNATRDFVADDFQKLKSNLNSASSASRSIYDDVKDAYRIHPIVNSPLR